MPGDIKGSDLHLGRQLSPFGHLLSLAKRLYTYFRKRIIPENRVSILPPGIELLMYQS
jgi:hypothetical protein